MDAIRTLEDPHNAETGVLAGLGLKAVYIESGWKGAT